MANIFLHEIHGSLYNPYNLVADMLLIGHEVVTKHLGSLQEFVTAYKQIHRCGGAPEDWKVLFARRLPSASADLGSSGNLDSTTGSSATTEGDAIAAAHLVPPSTSNQHNEPSSTSRALNFTPSSNTAGNGSAPTPANTSTRERESSYFIGLCTAR